MDRIGPGTLLAGRYRLQERVRADETTSSWRAEDATLERPVGVTVLSADHARVQSTLDAARRAALVDDARLQRVLGVGIEAGSGYVVLEWVTGQDAAALAGRVSEQEAVRIVTEAAEALRTAATRSLHHGRLGPHQVVRASDGSVRVLGTAVDVAATGQPTPAAAARPEARDVRDLTAVLYALATGSWPFGALGGLAAAPTERGRPVPAQQLRGDLSTPLDRLLDETLAGSGIDSLDRLVRALHETRAASSAATTQGGPAPVATSPAAASSAPGAGAPDDTDVITPVAARPGPGTAAAAAGGAAGAGGGAGLVAGAGASAGAAAAGAGATGAGAAGAGAAGAGAAGATGAAAGATGAAGAAAGGAAGVAAAGMAAAGASGPTVPPVASAAPPPASSPAGPPTSPGPTPTGSTSGSAAAPVPTSPPAPTGRVRSAGPAPGPAPRPVPPTPEDDGWDLLPVADDDWDGQDAEAVGGWDPAAYGPDGVWDEPQPWDDDRWPGPGDDRTVEQPGAAPVLPGGRSAPPRRRPAGAGTGVIVVLVMGAFVVGGLVWALDRVGDAEQVAAPQPTVTETVAPPSPEPSAPPAPDPSVEPSEAVVEVISPAGVQPLDPQGDGEENDQDAPRAIDGDPESGWNSQRYNSQPFGGLKDGLGLSFDLGEAREVSSVIIDAPGSDGTFEVRVADGPGFEGSTVVAEGQTGDGAEEIELDEPVDSQFVLVWFTSLPDNDGDWRAVVNEVEVQVR